MCKVSSLPTYLVFTVTLGSFGVGVVPFHRGVNTEMPCPEQGAAEKGPQVGRCGFWRCFGEKARLHLHPEGDGEGQHCDLRQEVGEGSLWRNRWRGAGCGVGRTSEVRSQRTWGTKGRGLGFRVRQPLTGCLVTCAFGLHRLVGGRLNPSEEEP